MEVTSSEIRHVGVILLIAGTALGGAGAYWIAAARKGGNAADGGASPGFEFGALATLRGRSNGGEVGQTPVSFCLENAGFSYPSAGLEWAV